MEDHVDYSILVPKTVNQFCGFYLTNYPLIQVELQNDGSIGPETEVKGISFDRHGVAMKIKMPCGETITFERFADIPEQTVMCPCGNPKHIAFEYR